VSASIQTSGLKEIIAELQKISTPKELNETNKKAFKRCSEKMQKDVYNLMPISKDVTKSGSKNSRTYQHSRDNIPVKITEKQVVIGWEKSDNSPYYYVKFIEFGTSNKLPVAPFKKTFIKNRKVIDEIFTEEYEKLLEDLKKVGG
jgi:HK97 gp10 family phage protein